MAGPPFTPPPGAVIEDFARVQLSRVVAGALGGANRQIGKYLTEFARVLLAPASANERRNLHFEIARAAQKSVLASYAQTVTRVKKVPSYRPGDRFADGALRSALGDEDFFFADARGIDFINRDLLDSRAAQWARLHAGAGDKGQGSRRRFDVSFSGIVVAALGLDMVPSAGFSIPPGYWWSPQTGQPVAPGVGGPAQFFRLGTGPRAGATNFLVSTDSEGRRGRIPIQKATRTGGIRERGFLDAGVATIARRLGPGYEELYRKLYARGVAQVRPQHLQVHVTTHGVTNAL